MLMLWYWEFLVANCLCTLVNETKPHNVEWNKLYRFNRQKFYFCICMLLYTCLMIEYGGKEILTSW